MHENAEVDISKLYNLKSQLHCDLRSSKDTDVKCHLRRVYTHDIAEALLQNLSVLSVTPAVKR